MVPSSSSSASHDTPFHRLLVGLVFLAPLCFPLLLIQLGVAFTLLTLILIFRIVEVGVDLVSGVFLGRGEVAVFLFL